MADNWVVKGGSSAGGGSPGGLDTYVQINNMAAFYGNAGFTYDYVNNLVTVTPTAGHTIIEIGEARTNLGLLVKGTGLGGGSTNAVEIASSTLTGLYLNNPGFTSFSMYIGTGGSAGHGFIAASDGSGTGGYDSNGAYFFVNDSQLNGSVGIGMVRCQAGVFNWLEITQGVNDFQVGSFFSAAASVQIENLTSHYSTVIGAGVYALFNSSSALIYQLLNNSQKGQLKVLDGSGTGGIDAAGTYFLTDAGTGKTSMYNALVSQLAGSGTRMVTTDASGNLGQQAIPSSGTPAGVDQNIQFNELGSTFGADTALNWDYTNHRLGIGTSAPSTNLEIYSSTLATEQVLMTEWASSSAGTILTGYTYSGSNSNTGLIIRGTSIRGTVASPSATQAGDILFRQVGRGYTNAITGAQADVRYVAASNWTSANAETYIAFYTTANGSTTNTERMRLLGSGVLLINTTAVLTGGPLLQVDGDTYLLGNLTVTGSFGVMAAASLTLGTPLGAAYGGFPQSAWNGYTASFSSIAGMSATISSQNCSVLQVGKVVFFVIDVTLNITVAGTEFDISLPTAAVSGGNFGFGVYNNLGGTHIVTAAIGPVSTSKLSFVLQSSSGTGSFEFSVCGVYPGA